MQIYTTIEERFCKNAGKNVAVEVIHHETGQDEKNCLHAHQCGEACSIHPTKKNPSTR